MIATVGRIVHWVPVEGPGCQAAIVTGAKTGSDVVDLFVMAMPADGNYGVTAAPMGRDEPGRWHDPRACGL